MSIKKISFFIFHSCKFISQKRQMQLPIKVIFDLYSPESKVRAIKFLYSKRLSCSSSIASTQTLTLGSDPIVGNIHKICRSMRCKNRETYVPKKTITQDNTYVLRQFAYAHGVVVISLFIGKCIRCSSTIFLSKMQHNPNLENHNIYIVYTVNSQWLKTSKKKSHGLSFIKSPIKIATLLYWVES